MKHSVPAAITGCMTEQTFINITILGPSKQYVSARKVKLFGGNFVQMWILDLV